VRTIKNPARGCGHLKEGALYFRSELDPNGVLPPFVEYVPPVPYAEPHFRAWRHVNGLAFDVAYLCQTDPCAVEWLTLQESAMHAVREQSPYGDAGARRAELSDHLARLWFRHGAQGPPASLGAERLFWTFDVLQWAGESFYPWPQDFISEVRRHGLNKRLPARGEIPQIVPGLTRLYILHKRAVRLEQPEAFKPGLIGYCYLTQVIYTAPRRGAVPTWIADAEKLGRVEVVKIGEAEGEGEGTLQLFEAENGEADGKENENDLD